MFCLLAGKWRKGERKVICILFYLSKFTFYAVPNDEKLGFSVWIPRNWERNIGLETASLPFYFLVIDKHWSGNSPIVGISKGWNVNHRSNWRNWYCLLKKSWTGPQMSWVEPLSLAWIGLWALNLNMGSVRAMPS